METTERVPADPSPCEDGSEAVRLAFPLLPLRVRYLSGLRFARLCAAPCIIKGGYGLLSGDSYPLANKRPNKGVPQNKKEGLEPHGATAFSATSGGWFGFEGGRGPGRRHRRGGQDFGLGTSRRRGGVVTDRRDEEVPPREPENPIEELIEGFEKTGWRPARAPWGEAQRRVKETEQRREELMKAWRRRRGYPIPDDTEDSPP